MNKKLKNVVHNVIYLLVMGGLAGTAVLTESSSISSGLTNVYVFLITCQLIFGMLINLESIIEQVATQIPEPIDVGVLMQSYVGIKILIGVFLIYHAWWYCGIATIIATSLNARALSAINTRRENKVIAGLSAKY